MFFLVFSLEPDFSYLEALAPYQPLAMKCIYCPIDTRLNFIQVSKLLKEVQVTGKPWRCPPWARQPHAVGVCGVVRADGAACLSPFPQGSAESWALYPAGPRGIALYRGRSYYSKKKPSVLFLMRTICAQLKANHSPPPTRKKSL